MLLHEPFQLGDQIIVEGFEGWRGRDFDAIDSNYDLSG